LATGALLARLLRDRRGRATPTIKVLLVDDHSVVRHALATLLATDAELEVVGQAGSVAEALAEARRTHPDVVVMDMRLPDRSGAEGCREIRSTVPEARVVILTSYSDEEALTSAAVAGASGYLLKSAEPDQLFQAVRTVAAGGSLLGSEATTIMLDRLRRLAAGGPSDDPLSILTDQEKRVLRRIAEGLTNREIGETLHLSENTVKGYVSNILAKLGLVRRSEAAAYLARYQARADERVPAGTG
jgi:two-component system, NarL family, response regulator DevR